MQNKLLKLHPVFVLIIGSIAILSLVIIKLMMSSGEHWYLNLMLALSIFGVIWYGLIFMMTNSGLIAEYPLLFNKGLPFYYLIAPCCYLYVRGLLEPQFAVFRLRDLRHFLIAIPAVLSILPYNLASGATQQYVVNQVKYDVTYAFSNSEYIVERWHWFTFPATALIYNLFQFKLTISPSSRKLFSRKAILWIRLFTCMSCLLFAGLLIVNLNVLSDIKSAGTLLKSDRLILLMGICLLLLSSSFFLNPSYEFGIMPLKVSQDKDLINPTDDVKSRLAGKFEQINVKMYDEAFTKRIESYIRQTEVFKNAGLTVSELAGLLEIPSHKLSDFLNNYHKVNFNTYINNIRIHYIKEKLERGDWKQFTLEAIAYEAGFSSRNTFHVYFKRIMGITPSAYLSELKAKIA